MIKTSLRDLTRATHRHRLGVEQLEDTKAHLTTTYLLLFYRCETGLKALWLRRHNLTGSEQVAEDLKPTYFSHDLRELARQLHLNNQQIKALSYATTRHGTRTIPVMSTHEAWRYGVELNLEEEAAIVDALRALAHWVSEVLG